MSEPTKPRSFPRNIVLRLYPASNTALADKPPAISRRSRRDPRSLFAAKVLHDWIVPLPARLGEPGRALLRCAVGEAVAAKDITAALLQPVVAPPGGGVGRLRMSPSSRMFQLRWAWCAQTPGRQSAISSVRTDRRCPRGRFSLALRRLDLSPEPRAGFQWWPTSCAIT
jgi:hypothetical protein